MQASAVKQKLEGASTFLSKLRWSKEMKNILINGISKKPSLQWNCTVASFCDQLYILHLISQLVFFILIKTIPTQVLHVHALIFQMPVFSAHIQAVSRSSSYVCMARGFWRWLSESHSFPVLLLEVTHASLPGMLEYTPCFPAMSAQVASSRDPSGKGPPLSPHATSQDFAHLHSESQAEVPACLVSLVLCTTSPSFCRRLSQFGSHPCLVAPAGSTGTSEECNATSSVSSCFLPHACQQIEVRKPRMCVYRGTYVTTLLPIVLPGQLGQKSAAGVPAGFEWGTAGSRAQGQGICKRQHFLAPMGFS